MLSRRLFFLIPVLVALWLPGAADGADYAVTACGTGANHSWAFSSNAALLESGAVCPTDGSEYGGLYVRDILASPTDMNDGEAGYWTFVAPAGLSVTGITYSRYLFKKDDEDLKPELRTSTGTVLDTCSLGTTLTQCSVGVAGTGSPATFTGLAAPALNFGVRCSTGSSAVQCVGGGLIHAARSVLYSATVTISDPVGPTVGAPAGSLTAGGWLHGTLNAGATASDASGVASERVLLVDGAPQQLATSGPSCDFTYAKPCPDLTTAPAIAVNTTTIADGPHTFAVTATDAAGNETLSPSFSGQVDNTPPTAPTGLTIAEGATTKATSLHASWSTPSGQTSPIMGAHWSLCPQAGGSCQTGDTASSSVTIDGIPEGALRLRVWLQDEAGNTSEANAAVADVTVNRTPPPPPPPPPATTTPTTSTGTSTGPIVPAQIRQAAGLKATRVLRGRRLTVGATLNRKAVGSVRFTVTSRRGTQVLARRNRSVRITQGVARFVLSLPHGTRRISIVARYPGSSLVSAASSSRTLVIQRPVL